MRLGTASLMQQGGSFMQIANLNLKKIAQKNAAVARCLFEYILNVEHNVKKALELAAAATEESKFQDWW